MIINDVHSIEYSKAWDLQKSIFQDVLNKRHEDTILLCEHPHVYTIGLHGNVNNMLVTDSFLEKIGAKFYHIDRGGDVTYHGPGQMVVYPILNIENYNLSLKGYIYLLEESIIRTIATWDITGCRKEGATGVWINDEKGERKICAIGVKASHFVTMHGLALNVNTDLKYFSYINPCGFADKGVTSIKQETGKELDIEIVKSVFCKNFIQLLENKKMKYNADRKSMGQNTGAIT